MSIKFEQFKLNLLFKELMIFASTAVLGLIGALRVFQVVETKLAIEKGVVEVSPQLYQSIRELTPPTTISISQFLISFFVATIIFLIILKTTKLLLKKIIFGVLFIFAVWAGCQLIFNLFLSFQLAFPLAIGVVALRFIFPTVATHNLAMVLGIAGISINFGLSLTVEQTVLILAILSLYDIIAVYKTRHMVNIFKGLFATGMIFAAIIPFKWKDFAKHLSDVSPGREFLFLGGGDLAFPTIFIISALSRSLISAVFTLGGAIVGLAVVHLLFVLEGSKKPMPALPPLVLFSILGYLISLLFI